MDCWAIERLEPRGGPALPARLEPGFPAKPRASDSLRTWLLSHICVASCLAPGGAAAPSKLESMVCRIPGLDLISEISAAVGDQRPDWIVIPRASGVVCVPGSGFSGLASPVEEVHWLDSTV